jgi:hypothetical protein
MQKYLRDLCWELGQAFAQPNAQHKSGAPPPKSVAMSYLGLGTWDPYEVVSPNFHALNGSDYTNWPQVTWELGLGTHVNPPLATSIAG